MPCSERSAITATVAITASSAAAKLEGRCCADSMRAMLCHAMDGTLPSDSDSDGLSHALCGSLTLLLSQCQFNTSQSAEAAAARDGMGHRRIANCQAGEEEREARPDKANETVVTRTRIVSPLGDGARRRRENETGAWRDRDQEDEG